MIVIMVIGSGVDVGGVDVDVGGDDVGGVD
jgi:hypothetical protein